ncbi:MFS transporter [Streptosporangium saharense]|uniref:MFS family permease n=1 Tax=Streptosporangium saharense TaxID=1706840 RepID=A0A7W7VSK0_9ACTN|nr:MFS transporter [Streptosporangium saharense]MBB4920505.1 MFS family permease [Streptosporangium saharense]
MSALANPRFRRLLVGQSLSTFGDSALYLSLGIWAKDLTGENAAAGMVFLCLSLPVVLTPFAGHIVDRLRRKPLLIAVNLVAGLGVLALLRVRSEADLWIIYAVALGYGLSFILIRPAQVGLVKQILSGEELAGANAAIRTVGEGIRLFSPLVGAAVYTAVGGHTLAVLDALTFAVAVVILLTLRVEEGAPTPPQEREPFRREIMAGFRQIASTPLVAFTTVAVAASFAVIGLLDTVDFAVIEYGLQRPASFFGVLMSVQGAGGICGGLVVATMIRRYGEARSVGAGLLTVALGTALLTTPFLPVVVAGFAMIGCGVPWLVVGYTTAWQRSTPQQILGRVAAAADLATVGPQTLSIALGAALIASVDYRILLAVCCAVLTLSGAVLLRRAPKLVTA